jgi:hypothetical protein
MLEWDIVSIILYSGGNRFCKEFTTWSYDSICSHRTLIILGPNWYGVHVHGEISRRTPQFKLAPAVMPMIVYNNVAIVASNVSFNHYFMQTRNVSALFLLFICWDLCPV